MKDLIKTLCAIAGLAFIIYTGWAFKDILFGIGYH